MLETLQFILSSFTNFWGTVILILCIGVSLNWTFAGMRGKLGRLG